jgi:hypothetical protein
MTYTATVTDLSGLGNNVTLIGLGPNGVITLAGGLALSANGSASLPWVVASPYVSGTYTLLVTAFSNAGLQAATAQMAVSGSAGVSIQLGDSVTGEGMPTVLTGTLTQYGLGLPGASLVITAPNGWGLSYQPAVLDAGLATARVTAIVTPPLGVIPDVYPLLYYAQLAGGIGVPAPGAAQVTVLGLGLNALLTPVTRTVVISIPFGYTLRVTNTGALPDTFTVAPAVDVGPQPAQIDPASATIALAPGTAGTLRFTATTSPLLVTGTYTITMAVASSLDTLVAVEENARFYASMTTIHYTSFVYLPFVIR